MISHLTLKPFIHLLPWFPKTIYRIFLNHIFFLFTHLPRTFYQEVMRPALYKVSVQSLSHVQLFVTPRTAALQASLYITNSWNWLKLMSIELVMPSNHLILCHPFLLPPSIFPSIRVFSNESVLHIRWPKYWNFSFSIHPSNEYSGLISFRMDWLDLLAVQGTLKSLPQHHSSKPSILQHSAFFIVQISPLYMTTRKTIALSRCTFICKIMSLLFNMLSRLVIAFLSRSKCLNFMAVVTICSDFGAPKNKVCHYTKLWRKYKFLIRYLVNFSYCII